jgi:hypothetical protein
LVFSDSDSNISPQQKQKAHHQALNGERGQLFLLQRRDFRLVDSNDRRLSLSHAPPLDLRDYL